MTISGKNQAATEFNGTISRQAGVSRRTAHRCQRPAPRAGRPRQERIRSCPESRSPDFANNDKWHDDVADGPVTAVVTLPGQEPVAVHHPSWVTVAPPDFAPGDRVDRDPLRCRLPGRDRQGSAEAGRKAVVPAAHQAADRAGGSLRWVNEFARWTPMATADYECAGEHRRRQRAVARMTSPSDLKNPGLERIQHAGVHEEIHRSMGWRRFHQRPQ